MLCAHFQCHCWKSSWWRFLPQSNTITLFSFHGRLCGEQRLLLELLILLRRLLLTGGNLRVGKSTLVGAFLCKGGVERHWSPLPLLSNGLGAFVFVAQPIGKLLMSISDFGLLRSWLLYEGKRSKVAPLGVSVCVLMSMMREK